MITEDYCSYEVAKLLKEKGFNEKCRGSYHCEFDDNDNPIVMLEEWMAQPYNNDFVDEGFLCSAPTHQMAMKWLREKGIHMSIDTVISSKENIYFNIDVYSEDSGWNHLANFCDSYEEEVEEALKYSLKNLI